jgi:hypothetical protein
MGETPDPRMLDKRVSDRYVKKGQLSEEERKRHLKSLPDLAESAAPIEATLEPMHVGTTGSHPEEE